jgi:hypothetical protein
MVFTAETEMPGMLLWSLDSELLDRNILSLHKILDPLASA